MNLPLITQDDIVIREPEPTETERRIGVRRVHAFFHRAGVMSISDREQRSLRIDLVGAAKMKLKREILTKLYPRDISWAIYEIRREFCGNHSIPHPLARDLNARLTELQAALTPEVK